jgi:hypothetical protein
VPDNDYHFVTRWRVPGTVQEVADILFDAADLGRWWPSVYLDVRELNPGDERGVGKEIALFTKGWLPYTLRWSFRVVEQHFPYGFTIEAFGDFVGRGVWTLAQDGPWVDIVYDWKIRADKPLLRWLSPLLRPLFEANHRWAMAKGEESLRLELARRHTHSAAERAAIPPPPPPTPRWVGPAGAGAAGALAVGLLALLARRAGVTGRPPAPAAPAAPGERAPAPVRFDPDQVAHFEAAGWRAYYERRWLRLLGLLVAMCQEQFHIPFPRSLQAAFYVTRAAARWAPVDHDPAWVRLDYERFYRLAGRYSGLRFDPAEVADLELRYNDVHRRLAGNPDKAPFVRTMVALHSALFGLTPHQARESAVLRVLANNVVDEITSRRSTDVLRDWARLEALLRRCYRSVIRMQDAKCEMQND